jgi:multidrug efflux pump
LLVDDAIIIVEMMVRKLEEGYDRLSASIYAYQTTAMPMLTGTLITAAGFLPIGMANSAVGEYTFAIFAVTSNGLNCVMVCLGVFCAIFGLSLIKRTSCWLG